MLWRRVQVERPRASTSGGHSAGGLRGVRLFMSKRFAVEVVLFTVVPLVAWAAKAENADFEVQLRQLG